MTAIDAIRAAGIAFKANVKFAFEGEEEAGSPNLEKTLAANKDLFAADLWLMCDAPVYQTRQQSIIFGARGVTRVDITVYGPRTELHSGHYGNWAPNPAMSLARLLASMKDDNGRVLVEHFYDDVEPLGPVEKQALAEAPAIDARPDAGVLARFDRRPTADAQRTDHDSVTQHPRHGQFAHRRSGVERDSVVGGRDDRRAGW